MRDSWPAPQARSEGEVNTRLLTRASGREKTRFSSSGPEPLQRFRSPKVEAFLCVAPSATDRVSSGHTHPRSARAEGRLADCGAGPPAISIAVSIDWSTSTASDTLDGL
jgi:hypothetical protein